MRSWRGSMRLASHDPSPAHPGPPHLSLLPRVRATVQRLPSGSRVLLDDVWGEGEAVNLNAVALDAWLQTRPECIRQLAARFPAGSRLSFEGAWWWVIGWNEDDMVLMTPLDPSEDYDAAVEAIQPICVRHLTAPTPTAPPPRG